MNNNLKTKILLLFILSMLIIVGCNKTTTPVAINKKQAEDAPSANKPPALAVGMQTLEGSLTKTADEDEQGTAVFQYELNTKDGNKIILSVKFDSEQRAALVKASKKKVNVKISGVLEECSGAYVLDVKTVESLDPGIRARVTSVEPDQETGDGAIVHTTKGDYYINFSNDNAKVLFSLIDKAQDDNRDIIIFTDYYCEKSIDNIKLVTK